MELPPALRRSLPQVWAAGRVLLGLREAMPCCGGESPARGCWGKGKGVGSPLAKGPAQQTAGGWGCPGDCRSIPAVPPCSSASLPWEPPRCPDECAGLRRRLLLATAAARQPEPPQSPWCHRHPRTPLSPSVAPCPCLAVWLPAPAPLSWSTLSGWIVGAAGGDLCPSRVQRKLCVFLLHWWNRMWPRLCHSGVFLYPIVLPHRSCSGAMLWAHSRGSD